MKKIVIYLIVSLIVTLSCNLNSTNSTGKQNEEIKSIKSSHPKRVNQKFITSFGNGDTLTVKSFFGETGIEYQTYEEALKNNGIDKMIIIKNVEHGGASEWKESYLLDSENNE